MKFKIGDKVMFTGFNEDYCTTRSYWELERYRIYTIDNCAFDNSIKIIPNPSQMFYSVTDGKGTYSWYKEEDFISLVESRKLKLDKINGLVGQI